MVGAAGALQDRLGPRSYIDAHLGRQFKEQLAVVRTLREQGRLGDVVVAHFGNNGPVKASQVDQLMAELSGVPRIVLVTVRVHKPWQNPVNRIYAEAATRFPALKIADWYGRSTGRLEWFQSDGTHLKPKGAQAYADMIAEHLPNTSAPAPPPPRPYPGWPLQPLAPLPLPPLPPIQP
jgi:hypothetical protein